MKYAEDIANQETINIAELRKAKRKHPILHWIRRQYLKLHDFVYYFDK